MFNLRDAYSAADKK